MKALLAAALAFVAGLALLTTFAGAAPQKLPVHFAYVELADRPSADFDASCATFEGYVAFSRAYFASQGADFMPDVRCVRSVHTFAEIGGGGDACGEGMSGPAVRSLIIMGELGWNNPVHNKTNERAAVMVTGGGGFAGNIDIFSGTQNVGLAIVGDRLASGPCGFAYGEPATICHELLHAFTVDADTWPALFCDAPLDAARLKQLLSSTNRQWIR